MVGDEGHEVPHDGETVGGIVVRGNVVMAGYTTIGSYRPGNARRLVSFR